MFSTTRLLVLGVVRIFQPVHGYEVRRELITWRAQEWASVKAGSIYNALKTLTRDGFLEVVGTDQVGGRPERTTYKLTSAGDEEFRILLREEWWTVRPPIDALMAAISFLGYVSRDEAIAALTQRTAQIHGMVRGMEFGIASHDGVESPPHVREMMRLMNARVLAEVEWAQQFIERLRRGEYSTAGDPPWQPASASALARNGATTTRTRGRPPAGVARGNGRATRRGRDAPDPAGVARGNGRATRRGRDAPDPGSGRDRPRPAVARGRIERGKRAPGAGPGPTRRRAPR